MKNLNREQLIELLQKNNCVVKFTKVNGELREMSCTLRPEMLPLNESKSIKAPNLDNLSVFCLDKKAWRSFRLANITGVEVA